MKEYFKSPHKMSLLASAIFIVVVAGNLIYAYSLMYVVANLSQTGSGTTFEDVDFVKSFLWPIRISSVALIVFSLILFVVSYRKRNQS